MLTELNGDKIIIGGDWNATWDSSAAETNIDTFFMRAIPSKFRSDLIKNIADSFSLTEPYRYMYPNKRDYTYIPNAVANNNRSRIDYFLITKNLISTTNETGINTGKLSTLFDHRAVFLNLGKAKVRHDKNKIQDSLLTDNTIKLTVELAVKEFYLNNADPATLPRYIVNTLRFEIGRILNKLSTATAIEFNGLKNNTFDHNTSVQIAELIEEATHASETLPALEYFENLILGCDPDFFFEGLV
jgi:hypothetical protein